MAESRVPSDLAPAPKENSVLKSASLAGLGTFFSRILGLVREQVFAVLFGASHAMDAFNIAFRIPNLLRDLFAEGAMSAALVPTFVRVRKEEGEKRAWRVAGLVFRVLFLIVTLLSIAGIFFADDLVAIYAKAYQEIPGKFELTVELTQVLFPFFPLVALAAAIMAILNACGVFFIPAFASAMFNAASIVTGVLLSFVFAQPIMGMAVGVVVGGAVQALWQVPALFRAGYRYPGKLEGFPAWNKDPALKKMMLLMVPGTLGLAATQINILVNSMLATGLGAGAVSWLNYAFRLLQFPIGIFGVSVAVATLPLISRRVAEGSQASVPNDLVASLRKVFAINLPASAGLGFLSVPIVMTLFQYGRFTAADTIACAQAVAAYAVGLVFYSAVKVLVPACYALGRTRLAVVSSVLSVVANLGLNLWLIGPFGFWGLALGTSLTAFLNFLFLVLFLKIPLLKLLRPLTGYGVVAVGMGGACHFLWTEIFLKYFDSASAGVGFRVLSLFVLVLFGIAFSLVLMKVFRFWIGGSELDEALELYWKKIKTRLKKK